MNLKIKYLFDKFLEGNCSKEELQDLLNHFDEYGTDSPLISDIRLVLEDQNDTLDIAKKRVEKILEETDEVLNTLIFKKKVAKLVLWPWVAAAVLFIFGLFVVFMKVFVSNSKDTIIAAVNINMDSNKEKISIRLPDGKIFDIKDGEEILEIDRNGCYYSYGSMIGDGLVKQDISIITPVGRQFKVKLPDGSSVWLNAASTLGYSSHFGQRNRILSLEGEAYFEIEHDPENPFIVKTGKQEISVLGTKFGLRSYQNEKARTTLIEGSIQVSVEDKSSFILKPGDQLELSNDKAIINQVDTESYVAWKDGVFVFHGTTLHEVLRELSRWYGLDINYLDIPNVTIYAEIHKNTPLNAVLINIEQASGVHFYIEGRRLMKK